MNWNKLYKKNNCLTFLVFNKKASFISQLLEIHSLIIHSSVICILFHSILVYICTVVVHLWLEWRCCRFELSTLDVKVARVAGMVITKSLRNWLERSRWSVVLALALVGWLRLILFGLVAVVGREVAWVLRTLGEIGHMGWRSLGHGVAAWDVKNGGIGLLELHQHLLAMLDLHERWLEWLDGVQDFFTEMVVADYKQSFLKNVITKLIIDQLLNYEIHSSL